MIIRENGKTTIKPPERDKKGKRISGEKNKPGFIEDKRTNKNQSEKTGSGDMMKAGSLGGKAKDE